MANLPKFSVIPPLYPLIWVANEPKFSAIYTHAIIITLRSQQALNQIYLQFSSRTFGLSNLALYLPAGREASGLPGPFLDNMDFESATVLVAGLMKYAAKYHL